MSGPSAGSSESWQTGTLLPNNWPESQADKTVICLTQAPHLCLVPGLRNIRKGDFCRWEVRNSTSLWYVVLLPSNPGRLLNMRV